MAEWGFSILGAVRTAQELIAEGQELRLQATFKLTAGDEDAYYALFVEKGARGGPPPIKFMERAVDKELAEFDKHVSTAMVEGMPQAIDGSGIDIEGVSGGRVALRVGESFMKATEQQTKQNVPRGESPPSESLKNSIKLVQIDGAS